jgi:hypothetical protein
MLQELGGAACLQDALSTLSATRSTVLFGENHMLLRAAVVWVVIALAETLHGILRLRFLNRRLGAHLANQIGVLSGSALIMAIGWLLMPWIAPGSVGECLAAGVVWLVLMLTFEFGMGHWYFPSILAAAGGRIRCQERRISRRGDDGAVSYPADHREDAGSSLNAAHEPTTG